MPTRRLHWLARMSLTEAKTKFVLHLGLYSPSTQQVYERAIRRFLTFAPDLIRNVKVEHIEQFILHLARTNKPSTVNLNLSAIKSMYNWLELNQGVPNIARRVKRLPSLPPKQRILSEEEYQKVIDSTDGYVKDCIQFLACTGLRASEFLSLEPQNISSQFITVVGKRKKQRSIPINSTVAEILNRNPHLNFIKSKNRTWLWRLCQHTAKSANIKPFNPHSLRHYFATTLHQKHIPIETIAKLLGHASVIVTESVYIHWKDEDLLGSTDCLDK